MDFDKIGNFIATLRKKKDLTQQQLEEIIGASYKTISKWENGKGFPDLPYQSKLCEALDIDLDELHAGELNLARRRHRKIRKIMNRLVIFYAAISIPLIIFLCFFFVNNYDSTKIYRIDTLDEKISAVTSGILIETNKVHLLYIGNINIWDYEISDSDIISVDIYSNEDLLFHTNKTQDITVKYDDDKEIDRNNLTIKILITDKKNKEHSYQIKLNVSDISNEDNQIKTPRISKLQLLSDKEIESNLKDAGFKFDGKDWKKIIKSKKQEENIMYIIKSNKLSYSKTDKTIIQNIIFDINSKLLEVYVFHQQDTKENIIFEKYAYNYNNGELDCQVGVCSTLESVQEMVEEYITLLIGE